MCCGSMSEQVAVPDCQVICPAFGWHVLLKMCGRGKLGLGTCGATQHPVVFACLQSGCKGAWLLLNGDIPGQVRMA